MGKGNAFLGTLRRSVGDVTFYRREGEQIARVRVRSVSNPKSDGQSVQRSFFAPVARFFSPFAVPLRQSFEGLSTSKSYSAFLKKNIDLARTSGWYLPKGAQFTPLPYMVSRGSLAPMQYEINTDGDVTVYNGNFPQGFDDTLGAFSRALVSAGYQDGDQITILAVMDLSNGDYLPQYTRFNLAVNSTVLMGSVFAGLQYGFGVVGSNWALISGDYPIAAAAIIVSRFENNVWRRSPQYMEVRSDILASFTSQEAYENALRSFGKTVTTTQSDVYLNGTDDTVMVSLNDGQGSAVTLIALKSITYNLSGGGTVTLQVGVDKHNERHQFINHLVASDNPQYGFILSGANSWVNPTGAPMGASNGIVIDPTNNDLIDWMRNKGVPASVFQTS